MQTVIVWTNGRLRRRAPSRSYMHMTRLIAVALALVFVAVAAAWTPLPGHYTGNDGAGTHIPVDFDGEHIRHLRLNEHDSTAWRVPHYPADNKSYTAGNSDGGFFTGHWKDATHVAGQFRYLS